MCILSSSIFRHLTSKDFVPGSSILRDPDLLYRRAEEIEILTHFEPGLDFLRNGLIDRPLVDAGGPFLL
jgi:hypothetical protein